MRCPCFSGKPYETCCKPYHLGNPAPTPEALMRSRYSAYALKKIDYIIATSHANLCTTLKRKEEIAQFAQDTSFDGLEILEVKDNEVTFRAHLSQNGKDVSFTEKSHFEKVDGHWKYHSGVVI